MQENQPGTVFFLGGCRSGKSRLAEEFAMGHFSKRCYVATMTITGDEEMLRRVKLHQAQREENWQLVEEPLDLCHVLHAQAEMDVVLIDCLTLWLTNLLMAERTDEQIQDQIRALVQAIGSCPATVVLVANEVGLGIVPDSSLGRRFRDLAGWLNQQVAEMSQRVIFVAAGLSLILKDE